MNWITLNSTEQLDEIIAQSHIQPVAIFKHSTRCSISSMAKSRLERAEAPEALAFYYLDLLAYRPISNEIAERFGVHHQSPQLLLIRNGECSYEESHSGIDMDDLKTQL